MNKRNKIKMKNRSTKLLDAQYGIFHGSNKEILEECFMIRKIEMKEEELIKVLLDAE